MNIKILDSWLRDFLKTKATPQEIAKDLSLTSISIERLEKYKEDITYDIEVTTNRPDLASVIGLAKEAAAVLPEFGIPATFLPPKLMRHSGEQRDSRIDSGQVTDAPRGTRMTTEKASIEIINDPTIVNRVCAVVMDVTVKESPEYIKDRLEAGGIRSLNNVIDVTNYVMRTIGHPTHVFDFDRLHTKKLTIRKAKKGETVVTLDKKTHVLMGGDIVAANDTGEIVDLLGVMGLENSVVTNDTKRILFFIDNNDASHMRKTSMSLGIRSEAVQLNEKGIDPELAMDALQYGISLYQEIAEGKIVSDIIDIYPNKPKEKKITVSEEKINTVIGVAIPLQKAKTILEKLGFETKITGKDIVVTIPSIRTMEVEREEDVIEEIARVYGYHNLPSILPSVTSTQITPLGSDVFYWEKRIKEAMKYWGYTETYTYSAVSETLFEGPLEDAVTIKNPLDEDHLYMRATLVPSLLAVLEENKAYKTIKIFEIANVYKKNPNSLPTETRMFAGILKTPHASFFTMKGLLEQLLVDMGIHTVVFNNAQKGGIGAALFVDKEYLGEIEVLSENLVNFELNFEILAKHATLKKTYTPLSKFPPIIEDSTFRFAKGVITEDVINEIKKQSPLIHDVSLLSTYENKKTFHIVYQDKNKNLTNEEVAEVRKKIITSVSKKFNASLH